MKRILLTVTLMLSTFTIPAQAADHRGDEIQAPRVETSAVKADEIQAPRTDEPQAPVTLAHPTP
jgi:hypothetical protein